MIKQITRGNEDRESLSSNTFFTILVNQCMTLINKCTLSFLATNATYCLESNSAKLTNNQSDRYRYHGLVLLISNSEKSNAKFQPFKTGSAKLHQFGRGCCQDLSCFAILFNLAWATLLYNGLDASCFTFFDGTLRDP